MTGIVILAAGSSSRLGSPKQNLIYQGETLLQRTIKAAIGSVCKPVLIVLGANADVIEPTINNLPVTIVFNPDFGEGMASSIRASIQALLQIEPSAEAVILMLCDQPFVDSPIINDIVDAYPRNKNGIVACSYNDTLGPPTLFDAAYFDELLALKGQEGAKKLLVEYAEKIVSVKFALGGIDIDTMGDYERVIAD